MLLGTSLSFSHACVAYIPTSFQRGHGVALAFAAANGLMALLLYILLSRENARREREYGSAPKEEEVHAFESEDYKRKWGLEGMTREQIVALGDDHPAYRYML